MSSSEIEIAYSLNNCKHHQHIEVKMYPSCSYSHSSFRGLSRLFWLLYLLRKRYELKIKNVGLYPYLYLFHFLVVFISLLSKCYTSNKPDFESGCRRFNSTTSFFLRPSTIFAIKRTNILLLLKY